MKLTKTKRKELKPGDMFCVPYKYPVSEVYMVLREDMIDSLSNVEVLRIEPDDQKKAEPETIEIEKAAGIALRDNGIIIAADIRALAARISEAETTASPTAVEELQEASTHLLRASRAVERAVQVAGMMTGECRYCHKNFEYPYAHGLIDMIRAHEATCEARPKGDDVTLDETDVPIVPQASAVQGTGT